MNYYIPNPKFTKQRNEKESRNNSGLVNPCKPSDPLAQYLNIRVKNDNNH